MFLLDLLNQICMPNPKVITDEIEFEVTFRRNKYFLVLETIGLLINIASSIILRQSPTPSQKIGLAITALILAVFITTCRSYPTFFKAFFFSLFTTCGPIMLVYNEDCIFSVSHSIHLLPTFVLYIVGTKASICQVIIQIIYLNFYYKNQLLTATETLDPRTYVPKIVALLSVTLVANSIIILMMQLSLNKAYQQTAIEKSKKMDLERQKTFLLSFSHEMRNLINTMIGAAQLSLLEALPTKVRSLLNNAEVCGELLLHLVNNILDTGKAEIGELEINPAPSNIYETLEKVWGICSQLIKTKRLIGKMRIQKTVPKVLKVDNYRLIQILMNLISNSIKFTELGSISIDVQWMSHVEVVSPKCFEPLPFDDTDEGQFEKAQATSVLDSELISLSLEEKKIKNSDLSSRRDPSLKGVLKIIVSDTGCGISPEKLPLLFSKFGQVSTDPAKRKLGTGLGLFITKELINKMGGEIQAFSKSNKGTVFIACFPAESFQENQLSHINMDVFLDLMNSSRKRALVVDDGAANKTLLSVYLNKLGVQEIEVAQNGQEAFEKYMKGNQNGKSFDIVTMDVNMPIMDGKKATELIRAYERRNSLSPCFLIMISGNCSESEIAACIETDTRGKPTKANYFLKKPVSINELFNLLRLQFENGTWAQ